MARRRLNSLDWLRALMVFLVVFAHTSLMGLPGGVQGAIEVDDRTYNLDDPSPYGVRWISVVRPWCLPLLFWVSGAAAACSWKGAPAGLDKLGIFTAVGMGFNALVWFLGPMNDQCSPTTKCPDQGTLFHFTICPWAGNIFPIIFQMWYLVFLIFFSVLNWPLFCVLSGQGLANTAMWLITQWLGTVVMYGALAFAGGMADNGWQRIVFVMLWLGFLEAKFMALAYVASPGNKCRPSWVPLRVVHYLMGLVVVLQFGCTPLAREITTIGPIFVLYILVGFNKFFGLGFVMTHPQMHEDGKYDAKPLCSRVWPIVLFAMVLMSPSTNWYRAGNLTYPYFPRFADRTYYVVGGMMVIFVFDRLGRLVDCDACPNLITYASLMLYLFHPVFMAVLIQFGIMDPIEIWISSGLIALAAVGALMKGCTKSGDPKPKGDQEDQEELKSDSESESE